MSPRTCCARSGATRAGTEFAALQPRSLQHRAGGRAGRSLPCGGRCSGCARWRRESRPMRSNRRSARCSQRSTTPAALMTGAPGRGSGGSRGGGPRGARHPRALRACASCGRMRAGGTLSGLRLPLYAGGLRVAGAGARGPPGGCARQIGDPLDWARQLEVPAPKLGRLLVIEDALQGALTRA